MAGISEKARANRVKHRTSFETASEVTKKALGPEMLEELRILADMPDEDIDTDDIPEAPAENLVFCKAESIL